MKLILISCFVTLAYGSLKVTPTPKDGVIRYNCSDESTSLEFRQELQQIWTHYFGPYSSDDPLIHTLVNCEQGEPPNEGSNKVCAIDANSIRPCDPESAFKYNSSVSGPCVYIQPTKIPISIPEYYNVSTTPDTMPQYLKDRIQEIEKTHGDDSTKLKVVWVSCSGATLEDTQNIGPINFHPTFGFDGKFFPSRNEDAYLAPFVAVHFINPQRGVSIKVECKAWALDFIDETVKFEIFIDE